MKILYHHRTLGDGAEGIHIREMVNAFRALGHEVMVIGPTGEPTGDANNKSRLLAELKGRLPAAFFELAEIAYNIHCFISLARTIKRFNPDFIYDRYTTFNAASIAVGRVFGLPVILEVNAPLAFERSFEIDERLLFKKTASIVERWICSHADRTIVVSTPLADYLRSIKVPDEKLVVMPNGVNSSKFLPRPRDRDLMKKMGIKNDAVVIGFSGVLRPWHNLEILVDAFANLVRKGLNCFLLIVGDGPGRADIEARIREVGLAERCRVTGRIPYDEMSKYVNLFDIAVCPKATFYASPMKLLEYMSMEKAVVVPDMPNFLDIVDSNVNSILFASDDSSSLETAIASLYTDSILRKKIGSNARSKVEKRLNWKWNAEEVIRIVKANCLK